MLYMPLQKVPNCHQPLQKVPHHHVPHHHVPHHHVHKTRRFSVLLRFRKNSSKLFKNKQ